MRSLWQDITALENTLPQLQKVGDELAATAGHRSHSIARAISPRKISIAFSQRTFKKF
jgi:hypothetical protein